MTQLEQRRMQLDESREALKSLQLDKTSLTQTNSKLEVQIKNLLEELKLTKDAAGDSGTQVSELNKNLRLARESSLKFENQSNELQKTLDIRTANWLKEKADIKMQLDKALADLKMVDSTSGTMISENRELRDELKTVKKKLMDTELSLSVLQDQIADKIEEILLVEKDKVLAVGEMERMKQEVKEIKESEEVLNQQLERAEQKLRVEQSKNDKLTGVTQGLQALHEKMKVGFQPIESTLSCLSCLEYLAEPNPHTLVCGHSICDKVSCLLRFVSF